MSYQSVSPHKLSGWECPVQLRFLGEHPVIAVNASEDWKECSAHPLSLVGACKIVASSIFGEKDRDAEIYCPTCRENITLFMIHQPTKESTITKSERILQESDAGEETWVRLENGKEVRVANDSGVKVGDALESSNVAQISKKTYTLTKVEYSYKLNVPQGSHEPPKVTEFAREVKTYKSLGPIVLHGEEVYTYEEALEAWKHENESIVIVSHTTSSTAFPILATNEGWEDETYAPLMRKLITTFQEKNQLDIALARQIRDNIRIELDLPLGPIKSLASDPKGKVTLKESDVVVLNDDSCCLAQLGIFNVLFLSAFTAATAFYAFTQGWFNNLASNFNRSDTNMRQHTTMKVEDPKTPYVPSSSFYRGPVSVFI